VVHAGRGAPPAADEAGAMVDRADGTAGYYLFGQGRPALIAPLQAEWPLGRSRARNGIRPARDHRAWRLPAVRRRRGLGTALLLAAVLHGLPHREDWTTVVALVLLAWPVSEALMALAQRIMAESVRVQALPGWILRRHSRAAPRARGHSHAAGIGREQRAAGAPARAALARQPRGARAVRAADRLGRRRHAKRRCPKTRRCSTTPCSASPRSTPAYPVAPAPPRASCCCTARAPGATTEQRWMGWERKRGKLEMLVRLLAGGDASGFLPLAPGRHAPGRRPHALRAHARQRHRPAARRAARPGVHCRAPAQRAADRPQSRRVVAGFGILQPRIVTPFPQNERSFFHWVFAGQCGLDPYSSGASDIYQDVFGSGSFTGKGLLNVRAVHATLDQRLPDRRRAEPRPARRHGRALRDGERRGAGGRPSAPRRRGRLARAPLGARRLAAAAADVARAPLRHRRAGPVEDGDNLRRSLVAPASFALLVLVVFTQAMPLGWALAAVAFLALHARAAAGRAGRAGADAPRHRAAPLLRRRHAVELLRAMAGAAWQFVQLAAQAACC
jgi:cyclic beta-1,2-glucan synthetase